MTFDEALHAECNFCKEPAMLHRMTDGGSFYCLSPVESQRWRKNFGTDRVRQWAMSVAKCTELRKSRSLTDNREIGRILVENLRVPPTPSAIADTLPLDMA